MKPVKVALVGCGFMGRMHAQVYGILSNVNLKICFSKHGESAKSVAHSSGAVAADTFEAILADDEITVVDICLPTDLHAEFAIRAMEAGKHVICEKPMAIDLASANRMLAASKSTGKQLMIAQCIRFWPEYNRLKQICVGGSLGVLTSLQLTRFGAFPAWSSEGWIGLEARSGGCALDMHIHDVDFACDLLGKPGEMQAMGVRDERGVSHIFSIARFGDTLVQMEGGWDLPASAPFRMSFRAVFENGLVLFDQGPLTIYSSSEPPLVVSDLPSMPTAETGGNISDLGGYFYELEYFYECLEQGIPLTRATPESSRDSLAVALMSIHKVG